MIPSKGRMGQCCYQQFSVMESIAELLAQFFHIYAFSAI